MKNPRIYQNTMLEIGHDIELDKAASHHLTRVLRLKNNATITLFNGNGHEFISTIIIAGKKVSALPQEQILSDRESKLDITLLQGISKGDRMDICIQKAVELGVNRIIPVICQRTVVNLKAERADKKHRHWQGIIISACEQSGRNILPELCSTVHLEAALNTLSNDLNLTLNPTSTNSLRDFKPDFNKVNLLIGPEGGLTQDEIALSIRNNFNTARLGKRILRTETAAIATISALQTLWGDFNDA